MSLYQKTQTRLLDELTRSQETVFNAKAEIARFEDLCHKLRQEGLTFEPRITPLLGAVSYAIDTTPEFAGEIMLTLCRMGCMEEGAESLGGEEARIVTVSSDCAPTFSLAISPFTVFGQRLSHAAGMACCAGKEA